MSAEHPAACPYCGKPKVDHAYASLGSCVIARQARSVTKPSQQEGTETVMGLFGETVKASAATGRLARFAHRHDRCRKLLWRLRLIPNVIGPFYRSGE